MTKPQQPERFDDEGTPRVVPPCAVERYIRNLARLRQLCINAQSPELREGPLLNHTWATLAEVEAGLAEIQLGLEHHRSVYIDAEKAAAWQGIRDSPAKVPNAFDV